MPKVTVKTETTISLTEQEVYDIVKEWLQVNFKIDHPRLTFVVGQDYNGYDTSYKFCGVKAVY
jgi:hypothetical protein